MKNLENRMIYGDVPEHIEQMIASTLEREVQPMKRKRLSTLLLTAIILLALACTALAVSLLRSPEQIAIRDARDAVMDAYGFTVDSMGIFNAYTEESDAGTKVVFTPIPVKYYDKLGTYEVKLMPREKPQVSWSYDGIVDPVELQQKGYDTPVWGAKQLGGALVLEEAYLTQVRKAVEERGEISLWTMEERAELDKMLLDAGYADPERSISGLPGPDDLQVEDAVQIALDAIYKEFGVKEEALSEYSESVWYQLRPWEENWIYNIGFQMPSEFDENGILQSSPEGYQVEIVSPSGEVRWCTWAGLPENASLPEGSLEGKQKAVETFFMYGGFERLSPAEKADAYERLQAAGLGSFVKGTVYVAPAADGIDQAEAERIAVEAIMAKYGFTEDALFLFTVSTDYILHEDVPVWRSTVKHDRMGSRRPPSMDDALGVYRAFVAGDTGAVQQVEWSHDGEVLEDGYDAGNWAEAPMWPGELLPYVTEFAHGLSDLLETIGEAPWPIEHAAAYAKIHTDAGFSKELYSDRLPGDGDMQQTEALALAKEALMDQFGLSRKEVDGYRVLVRFYEGEPAVNKWNFAFWPTEIGRDDSYLVEIVSTTGEIVELQYVAMGNG